MYKKLYSSKMLQLKNHFPTVLPQHVSIKFIYVLYWVVLECLILRIV